MPALHRIGMELLWQTNIWHDVAAENGSRLTLAPQYVTYQSNRLYETDGRLVRTMGLLRRIAHGYHDDQLAGGSPRNRCIRPYFRCHQRANGSWSERRAG
jgi:hypothetical protein